MNKLPLLISYAFLKKSKSSFIREIVKAQDKITLLIDSGAFTAFTQGEVITLDEYMDFLKNMPFKCERYFMLDVIGDEVQTKKNLRIMYEKGFKPIPIFTRGAKAADIDEMYKFSDIVALGGVAVKGQNTHGYVKFFMDNICKGRKIHWLGWGDLDFLLHYKPRSYDNSSAFLGSRFGSIGIYDKGRIINYSKKEFNNFVAKPAMAKACEELDGNVYDLKENDNWSGWRELNNMVTVASHIKHRNDMIRRIGTIPYIACMTHEHIEISTQVFEKLKNKGVL